MVAPRSRSWLLVTWLALGATGCQASASGQLRVGASGGSAAGSSRMTLRPHLFYNRESGAIESDQFVEFDYNEAKLKSESFEVLGNLRDLLRQQAQVQVRIEGHTDSRGTPDYNKELSRRRAEAIKAWLVAQGVEGSRITTVGLGEERAQSYEKNAECYNATPRSPATCEDEWRRSRQAVYVVTAGADTLKADSSAGAASASGAGAGAGSGASTAGAARSGYGMAGCGLGAVLIADRRRGGQIFAATSNASSASQTSGITSNTSHCGDGPRADAARAFVEANREALAKDIARGKGEALDTLASVAGCADPAAVRAGLRARFREVFPDAAAPTDAVSARLLAVMREPALGCALSSAD